MNTEELSNEFDIAVNAYLPGGELFDEYEKSKFLTEAQEKLVLQLYNSFEKREIVKEILAPLVRTAVINEEYDGEIDGIDLLPISDNSFFYKLPDDLWLITYEEAVVKSTDRCLNNKRLSVAPTTQDKLYKILRDPFKGANENRTLRLNVENNVVEIISKYDLKRYYVRYIKKLKPIILTRLTDSTSILGLTERTECELHKSLHRDILDLAVQLALRTRRITERPQYQQPQQEQQQNEQQT